MVISQLLLTSAVPSATISMVVPARAKQGNAVRKFRERNLPVCNSAAAPATVSGEPTAINTTGDRSVPGKVVEGSDPRARKPAISRGHARAHWAGCPRAMTGRHVSRASGTCRTVVVRGDGSTFAASACLVGLSFQSRESQSAVRRSAGSRHRFACAQQRGNSHFRACRACRAARSREVRGKQSAAGEARDGINGGVCHVA